MNAYTEIYKKYRITEITQADESWAVYAVHSTSGKIYEVKNVTNLDELGSIYFEWRCDCPARKRCRHIDAVEAYRDVFFADDDDDGDDDYMMERQA